VIFILLPAVIVAVAVLWGAGQVVRELRAAREEASRGRALAIIEMFTPALQAVREDPRVLIVWQPLARAVRQLYPIESAAVDRAAGGAFPFGRDMIAAAHARWTSDWLSWEGAHDADYKLKAAVLQQELAATGESVGGRARLEAVEREKLAIYQRRYEEYTRVAKSLQAMATTSTGSASAAGSAATPAAE
jgi:hypothetical protein